MSCQYITENFTSEEALIVLENNWAEVYVIKNIMYYQMEVSDPLSPNIVRKNTLFVVP